MYSYYYYYAHKLLSHFDYFRLYNILLCWQNASKQSLLIQLTKYCCTSIVVHGRMKILLKFAEMFNRWMTSNIALFYYLFVKQFLMTFGFLILQLKESYAQFEKYLNS